MRAVDLFAGCGGLSLGFRKAGYTIEKAVEFDPVIADTYRRNHPDTNVLVDDIKNIDRAGVFTFGTADVIIGGPPCQGFSMAGARIRRGFIDDPRNYLFKHYFHVVKQVKPKAFVMENVKGMQTMQGGKIFREIQRTFSDGALLDGEPYQLFPKLINTAEFGIPQKRQRLILVGTTRLDVPFERLWEQTKEEIMAQYPDYFTPVSIRDAIGNLPAVTKDGRIANPAPQTAYEKYLSCGNAVIENHRQSRHSAAVVARMEKIKNGENYTALQEKINSVHSGAYGRLCWEEQAPTITTRFDTPAGGRFTHPDENRTLTPREAARIQSFPDDFVFYGDKRSISRQIGNAVPPKVAYFLACFVENILKPV